MALGLRLGDTVTVCMGVGAVVKVWGEEEVERTVCVCVCEGRAGERERERVKV